MEQVLQLIGMGILLGLFLAVLIAPPIIVVAMVIKWFER